MQPAIVPDTQEMAAVLGEYRTETGRTLLDLVDESPLLLIFLRHFGCSFCRQTLDDVSRIRAQIEARGIRPVFVHLGTPERAKPMPVRSLQCRERAFFPSSCFPRSGRAGC